MHIYKRGGQSPVPELGFLLCLCVFCRVGFEWALLVYLLFRVPRSKFVPVIMSYGPGSLILFIYVGSSLYFVRVWRGVSAAFQHARTG